MHNTEPTPVWLRRFTKLVAASTLFLIFAGAMVTSTGSGLAVPDWPLSYGMLMPPMVGGIFYEHGHRMIAAAVGFLTLVQAFWLQFREPKRFVRILGWIALGAVIVQGLLGGLTVIFLLPLPVSVGHASLAQLFFCTNVAIAYFTSLAFLGHRSSEGTAARATASWAAVLAGAVFLQTVIGALMRHLGAGLAIPDFPLAFGRIVPDLSTLPVAVNYAHRLGAVVVTAIAIRAALLAFREPSARLRSIHACVLGVISLQIMLGGFTVWSGKHPVITSIHVATGALTLALAVLSALSARTLAGPHDRHAPLVAGEAPA
jgi:cytochrome c oxidase assembly protein subunit 15